MTSKIKVDNIENQCGGAVVTKCGATTTISGSVVKADDIQAADGGNLINQCGTTITLGASGDTINLASGASQTGFGRTGTVDWQTGSIKTATFTAVNGEGYFANTSGGTFTMNLPAGSAGAIVSVVDYTNTFQTNNLTIAPNGAQKIGGVAASNTLSTEGQSVTFVYVDDTEGWKNIQDSTSNVTGNPFIQATGGTITTCGNCRIHTFTGPGTFTVSSVHPCAANNLVSHLVVAGGGGGGSGAGGGGGAGGYREVKSPVTPYTASPKDGYPSAPNRVTVTAQAYPIAVGAGGAVNSQGVDSTFSTITSAKGGKGSSYCGGQPTMNGGSGGGARSNAGGPAGSGNTPPVSPPQGNPGGTTNPGGTPEQGGGGGGASGSGGNGSPGPSAGGTGTPTSITGSATAYAGGGGGGANPPGSPGPGSPCGTGGSGQPSSGGIPANIGTINTGGAGGGSPLGTGGSGIVVIRYKFQ
jgi:hypothetical protein